MNDLISRQEAIDTAEKESQIDGAYGYMDTKSIIDMLEDLPSAQPEIIRCKDCRWRKDQSGSIAWLPCRAIVTPSDFYCGRAERRTEDDETSG